MDSHYVEIIDPRTGEGTLKPFEYKSAKQPAPLIVQPIVDKPRDVPVKDPTLADFYEPQDQGDG